ncbi:DUF116 domain-containing protein [Planctomycetota bacterium]
MFEQGKDIIRSSRQSQENIPGSRAMRDKLRALAEEYVSGRKLVGPISLTQLRKHCETIIRVNEINYTYIDFLAILVNNQIWRPVVSATSYDKRLLLLAKCLRDEQNCPAEFDNLGLVCEKCGRCVIGDIKSQAEDLGYAVLVAEGSPIVMSLISTGKIQAIVGVSCMNVLEKTFAYMEAGAVPGVAIPLLYDGCADTEVDVDWVLDALYENSAVTTNRLDMTELRDKVNELFQLETLRSFWDGGESETEEIALKWMAKSGKRWRPFIAVCAHHAMVGSDEFDDDLVKAAIAVECFHKASLIHDDIEDGDALRYGEKTLHEEFGIPIALNVGDLLLGQGAELQWRQQQGALSVEKIIEIFEKKTSPAFEVALKIGVLSATADSGLDELLKRYCRALGVAYQIRDDIDDFDSGGISQGSASLFTAIAAERAGNAKAAAIEMLDDYKQRAVTALEKLDNACFKQLLRRMVSKIFNEIDMMGCCNDYTKPNDSQS